MCVCARARLRELDTERTRGGGGGGATSLTKCFGSSRFFQSCCVAKAPVCVAPTKGWWQRLKLRDVQSSGAMSAWPSCVPGP